MEKKSIFMQEGPPFMSNNNFHSGTALISFIKSTFQKFYELQKYDINHTTGSDCHGLPSEMHTMKMLNLKSVEDIKKYGIDNFNEKCKEIILQNEIIWDETFHKLGRDTKEHYRTMDENYMNNVIWAYNKLNEMGLIYKGYKVLPYSYGAQCCLSNFEANENYQKTNTNSIYVKFNTEIGDLLVWTTTPWTLVANQALAINENLTYYVNDQNIISCKPEGKTLPKKWYVNLKYKPIFNYYNISGDIIHADFVKNDETGIVHLCPFFGEDDFDTIGCKNPELCPINSDGTYNKIIPDYEGRLIFDCNKDIINQLKKLGAWYKTKGITHNYPYCPRTNTPLIYKISEEIFVKVSELKEKILKLNEDVIWYPKYLNKQFIDWITNAKDWCISRRRFFGTKIPNTDFVFDCWFESGCSPFAQHEGIGNFIKSDFVYEGLDQYNHYYYTMFVICSALFNESPCKRFLCSGIIMDEKGQKISKSKGNFINPLDIINKYGADAYRLYLLNSPVIKGEQIKFKENDIFKMKSILIQLANAKKLYKEYKHHITCVNKSHIFNEWILNKVISLNIKITNKLRNYELDGCVRLLLKFIEIFCNIYLKYMRIIIKDKNSKYVTSTLLTIKKVFNIFGTTAYPFMPFFNKKVLTYTEYNDYKKNKNLNKSINNIISIISDGNALRAKNKLNLRTVVTEFIIYTNTSLSVFLYNIIKNELNTINLRIIQNDIYKIDMIQNINDEKTKKTQESQDIARMIQMERKKQGFHAKDNITITVYGKNLDIKTIEKIINHNIIYDFSDYLTIHLI
jgi:isoleucyl-tRNA synthetase